MKKHPHTTLSDKNCPTCGKPIKQNLADRKRNPECFACFRVGKPMQTARDIRRHPELRSKQRWDKFIPLRTMDA